MEFGGFIIDSIVGPLNTTHHGSYMFEFSVSKDMKSMLHMTGDGSREGSGTFTSSVWKFEN